MWVFDKFVTVLKINMYIVVTVQVLTILEVFMDIMVTVTILDSTGHM